jgi:uncharacterized protein DUF6572
VSRSGLQHPQIVDLITRAKDGTFRLIIAETDAVAGERILALQEKLKNYLSFAKDGPLVAKYPEAKGAPIRIRVDLYAQPDALTLEFLRRFRTLALKESVDVELSIFQKDVAL